MLTSEGISKANEILKRPSKLGHSPCFKKLFDRVPLVGEIIRSRTIEQLLQIDQSESSVYTCCTSEGGGSECHKLRPNTVAENHPPGSPDESNFNTLCVCKRCGAQYALLPQKLSSFCWLQLAGSPHILKRCSSTPITSNRLHLPIQPIYKTLRDIVSFCTLQIRSLARWRHYVSYDLDTGPVVAFVHQAVTVLDLPGVGHDQQIFVPGPENQPFKRQASFSLNRLRLDLVFRR